jgi:TM2 domain-containing membrane protein YozV
MIVYLLFIWIGVFLLIPLYIWATEEKSYTSVNIKSEKNKQTFC